MRVLWAYLKDDGGQTSVEYILLVAVAAMIVFKFRDIATETAWEANREYFWEGPRGH